MVEFALYYPNVYDYHEVTSNGFYSALWLYLDKHKRRLVMYLGVKYFPIVEGIIACLRQSLPVHKVLDCDTLTGRIECTFTPSAKVNEKINRNFRKRVEKVLSEIPKNTSVLELMTEQATEIEFLERDLQAAKRAAEMHEKQAMETQQRHDAEIRKLNACITACKEGIKNLASKLNENKHPVEADEDDAPLPSLF
jgi:hypothetical protein